MTENNKRKILFLHSAGPQHGEEGSAKLVRFLKEKLGASFQLIAPIMPHPDDPSYSSWKTAIREIMKIMDDDMILIGHSLGGSVLLKYLSEEPVHNSIRALYLIAVPYWGIDGWDVDEFILRENFPAYLPGIDNIIIYQSKDDKTVTINHADEYASKMPGAEYHLLDGHGHVYWNGLPELIEHIKDLPHQP